MKTLERKDRITARRAAHHAALETLRAPGCKTLGALLWKRLRQIEARAHDAATAQCNGTEGSAARPTPWEAYETAIRAEVAAVFGGVLPAGFFLNQDCRGYALKLHPEKCTVPLGMSTDWGRNGILAAEINDI